MPHVPAGPAVQAVFASQAAARLISPTLLSLPAKGPALPLVPVSGRLAEIASLAVNANEET